MVIATTPKELVLSLLPDPLLQIIKKVHYAKVLRSISDRDEPDFKVLRYLVTPTQSVADVGANIGIYTKFLSDLVSESGHVYSVEPVPSTFALLLSNVKKLGLRNVELKNCAISSSDGSVTMQVPKYKFGGENFYEARVVGEAQVNSLKRVEVPCFTIDSLFYELPVSFIKCDVEGHELNVIKGAMRTIQKFRPAWLIELSGSPDEAQSTSHETIRILTEGGYQPYWFDGIHLRLRNAGDQSVNYFFLTPKHVSILRERGCPFLPQ
jgi:FkbM family methyltransferase